MVEPHIALYTCHKMGPRNAGEGEDLFCPFFFIATPAYMAMFMARARFNY